MDGKPKRSRLGVDLDLLTRKRIKIVAAHLNLTIKMYVTLAIHERLVRDENYLKEETL
jgi:hypothetical protein